MIGRAVDAFRAAGGHLFLRYVAILLGLSALKGLFQFWMRVILIGISRDIEYDLRNDLFRHLAEPLARLLRPHAHRRHHGARHQRPQRRAHDARPRRDVLVRDQSHLRPGHRRHAASRLAPGALRHPARARRQRWR